MAPKTYYGVDNRPLETLIQVKTGMQVYTLHLSESD